MSDIDALMESPWELRGERWVFVRGLREDFGDSVRPCKFKIVRAESTGIKPISNESLVGLVVPAISSEESPLVKLGIVEAGKTFSYSSDIEALMRYFGKDAAANLFHLAMEMCPLYIHSQDSGIILPWNSYAQDKAH